MVYQKSCHSPVVLISDGLDEAQPGYTKSGKSLGKSNARYPRSYLRATNKQPLVTATQWWHSLAMIDAAISGQACST